MPLTLSTNGREVKEEIYGSPLTLPISKQKESGYTSAMNPESVTGPQTSSAGKDILRKRFASAFSVAHWFLIFSSIIRMVGALAVVVGAWQFLVSLIPRSGIQGAMAFGSGILALVAGLVLGTMVAAIGHLLNSTTVIALNSSSIATDAEKEELIAELMPVFRSWAGFTFGASHPSPRQTSSPQP